MHHAMSDAGLMYFDAYVVKIRIGCRLVDQRFAIAKTDLQNNRRVAAKQFRKVERHGSVVKTVARP